MTRALQLSAALCLSLVTSCHRHGGGGGPPGTLNVLFIGDSYTSTNDLPDTFSAFLEAADLQPGTVTSVIVPGSTLEQIWTGSNAASTIAQGGWTHVVIQGQSVEPCLDAADFLTYAAKFAEAALAVQAQPVFFETWPRQAGNSVYEESWSGGTPQGMLACLKAGYSQAAQANGGVVAPVGDAWMAASQMTSDLVLYQSDGSHPTSEGTFLATAVLLNTIGHTSPANVVFTMNGVSDADLSLLESIAAAAQ
jgi:hypothetical protein